MAPVAPVVPVAPVAPPGKTQTPEDVVSGDQILEMARDAGWSAKDPVDDMVKKHQMKDIQMCRIEVESYLHRDAGRPGEALVKIAASVRAHTEPPTRAPMIGGDEILGMARDLVGWNTKDALDNESWKLRMRDVKMPESDVEKYLRQDAANPEEALHLMASLSQVAEMEKTSQHAGKGSSSLAQAEPFPSLFSAGAGPMWDVGGTGAFAPWDAADDLSGYASVFG